jgi:uncharacterized membrane protein
MSTNIDMKSLTEYRGIFGMGISTNYYLDLFNLSVLALAGLLIVYFFKEKFSGDGNSGPARVTIWGLGLTTLAVFLMIFISISDKINIKDKQKSNIIQIILNALLNDALPIIITFILLIYFIYLNFVFYKKINKNNVSNTYDQYNFYSMIIFAIQIILISKYLYGSIGKRYGSTSLTETTAKKNETAIVKNLGIILGTINFLFIIIMHILLQYFSTDG